MTKTQVIGYVKGKSAISITRNFKSRKRNFTRESFWARGFYVSTLGHDEDSVNNGFWMQCSKGMKFRIEVRQR